MDAAGIIRGLPALFITPPTYRRHDDLPAWNLSDSCFHVDHSRRMELDAPPSNWFARFAKFLPKETTVRQYAAHNFPRYWAAALPISPLQRSTSFRFGS